MRLLIALLLAVCCAAQVPMSQPFGLPLQPRLSWLGNRNAIPGYGLVGAWDLTSDNLLRWSEDLDNDAWEKVHSTITPNATADPTGALTADKLVEDATPAVSHYIRSSSVPISPGPYILTIYIKAAERSNLRVWLASSSLWGGSNPSSIVSLSADPPTASDGANLVAVGGGWYLFTLAVTAVQAGSTNLTVDLRTVQSTYDGDGASGIYIWGAQLTEGTTPKPYVRTTDGQSVPNFAPGQTAALQLGSTAGADANDPVRRQVGLVFDGVDDSLANIPAKAAAWTVICVSPTEVNAVDSAGGGYVNGVANPAAAECDPGTAGGYTGTLSKYLMYNRVLAPVDHANAYRYWRKLFGPVKGLTLP